MSYKYLFYTFFITFAYFNSNITLMKKSLLFLLLIACSCGLFIETTNAQQPDKGDRGLVIN